MGVGPANGDEANGEMYGPGCYFAESVSRADCNSRPRNDGLRAMIISRVVLGSIYSTTEKSPDAGTLREKATSGGHRSICGDRRDLAGIYGGWRDFVVLEEAQSMPLFLVWYRRQEEPEHHGQHVAESSDLL